MKISHQRWGVAILKKVLIGIAALVILLAAGLVVFVATFDADRYKPAIENAVHQHTGRALAIDGKLSLSVFPNVALALPRLSLSERDSARPFASLERARVSVALLPLFAGEVKADTVSLVGLRATIERHADGSTSIDDLTGRAKAVPQGAPSGGPGPSLATLELGGLDIVDAAVKLHDEKDDSTLTLSHINVRIGRIAPHVATPATASAALDLSQPPTHADIKLSADGVAYEANQARIAKLLLELKATQADQAVALSLTGPAIVDIATGRLDLPKLDGSVEVELPSLRQKTLKVAFAGTVSVDQKAQQAHTDASLRFDDSTATLKAGVEDFSMPRIAFDANIDRLDIDRYLKPASAGSSEKSADRRTQAAAGTDSKVDLSVLKALHLDGRLAFGSLKGFGLQAAKVQMAMKAAGGRLDVAPLSAALYEGTLKATARAEAVANRVAVKADLAGISIGPLLKDLAGKEIVDGHGNVDLDLTTQGASIGAMRRALGGSAAIALRDGAVHGVNVPQKLRDLRSAIKSGSFQNFSASAAEKTDFSELSAHFVVRDGVASNHDLQLASPLLRATGEGSIDIGALALDYTAKISLVGTLEGQGGQALPELKGVTVPLHVSGPFDNLAFGLDWRNVAQQALEKTATEQLKSRVGGGGKPADLLKGLLGR